MKRSRVVWIRAYTIVSTFVPPSDVIEGKMMYMTCSEHKDGAHPRVESRTCLLCYFTFYLPRPTTFLPAATSTPRPPSSGEGDGLACSWSDGELTATSSSEYFVATGIFSQERSEDRVRGNYQHKRRDVLRNFPLSHLIEAAEKDTDTTQSAGKYRHTHRDAVGIFHCH